MVKNIHGGNKHKSFARKNVSQQSNSNIRLPEGDLEVFAIVTKFLGNSRFNATTRDKTFITTIPKKFNNRSKYSNMVTLNSIVLIGLREWEAPDFKKADLLEVYDSNEMQLLFNNPLYHLHALFNSTLNSISETTGFSFDDNLDDHQPDTPNLNIQNASLSYNHNDLDFDFHDI
jgi:hypothetical protein